jgi:hypothetical protein
MQLNPAEISELIKSRIEGLSASADIRNQGTVVSVTDGNRAYPWPVRCDAGRNARIPGHRRRHPPPTAWR